MKQADLGLNLTTKRTRKREFLAEMERVVPWAALVALITPYAPEGRRGRPPFPVETMLTGWQARFDHFMSPDFFGANADSNVTFKSTAIEVTGEKTAKITGDLTLNGVTKSVVLDAALTQAMERMAALREQFAKAAK